MKLSLALMEYAFELMEYAFESAKRDYRAASDPSHREFLLELAREAHRVHQALQDASAPPR